MTSSSTVDVRAGVAAALVCAGAGFLAEFVLAAWAYRKPGFRSLRVREGGSLAARKREIEREKRSRTFSFFLSFFLSFFFFSLSRPRPRTPPLSTRGGAELLLVDFRVNFNSRRRSLPLFSFSRDAFF
jgi:hypothetical protein